MEFVWFDHTWICLIWIVSLVIACHPAFLAFCIFWFIFFRGWSLHLDLWSIGLHRKRIESPNGFGWRTFFSNGRRYRLIVSSNAEEGPFNVLFSISSHFHRTKRAFWLSPPKIFKFRRRKVATLGWKSHSPLTSKCIRFARLEPSSELRRAKNTIVVIFIIIAVIVLLRQVKSSQAKPSFNYLPTYQFDDELKIAMCEKRWLNDGR